MEVTVKVTVLVPQEAVTITVPFHQEAEQLAQLPGDQEDHQRQEAARPLHLQQGQEAEQEQGEQQEQGVTMPEHDLMMTLAYITYEN